MSDLTASDLIGRLQVKFPVPDWCSFAELREGTGFRDSRYIDFWAMHAWPSKRHLTVSVEVKISRADFRRELDQPQKRQFWEESSNEFWFCAPKGVIPVEELPEGCGLYETWGSGLRATRRAKQRMDNQVDPDTWIAIARRAAEQEARSLAAEEPFAHMRGREVRISDLRRLAEKLYGRSDVLREYDIKAAAHELARENAKKDRGHLPAWQPVFDAIRDQMRREQSGTWDWYPTPEEALAWFRAIEAPRGMRHLAQRMRDVADEMDPPQAQEESA